MEAEQTARFRALVLPQLNAAYNFARYLIRDPSHAEDMVQDAYLRAFTAFGNFRGGDAKSWLLTIVRNCCMTWLSKQADDKLKFTDSSTTQDQETTGRIEVDATTPESEALRAEASATLHKLIADLPQAMREVLVLRELEELSYREIAAIVDAPIGTVMSRLARARTQLNADYRRLRMSEVGP